MAGPLLGRTGAEPPDERVRGDQRRGWHRQTRLMTEWAEVARTRGFVMLAGRAMEGGGSFRPLAQALMQAVRDRNLMDATQLRPFRAALSRVLPGSLRRTMWTQASIPHWCWARGAAATASPGRDRNGAGSGRPALGRSGHRCGAGLSRHRTDSRAAGSGRCRVEQVPSCHRRLSSNRVAWWWSRTIEPITSRLRVSASSRKNRIDHVTAINC